jgi:hypothetical protein
MLDFLHDHLNLPININGLSKEDIELWTPDESGTRILSRDSLNCGFFNI